MPTYAHTHTCAHTLGFLLIVTCDHFYNIAGLIMKSLLLKSLEIQPSVIDFYDIILLWKNDKVKIQNQLILFINSAMSYL